MKVAEAAMPLPRVNVFAAACRDRLTCRGASGQLWCGASVINGPFLRTLTVVLALLLILAATGFAADEFKAGIARRDITPKAPVPMWGYSDRHDQLSTGTLDPLTATALVLQTGETRLAIVGLDLGRSPSEKSLQNIRQRILKETGIKHSMIAGSHTHHGPVLELSDEVGKGKGRFDAALRYYKELEDAIVAAVIESNQSLVNVKLATGSVKLTGFNHNRHSKLSPKPVETSLSVMRLDDESDKPLAVLINFAGHPTSLPAGLRKFSADYVGALRATVEQNFGGKAVFMQGACGDLSVNSGPHADYLGYGKALGDQVVTFASSLKPEPIRRSALDVREERFRFESRMDLNNPVTRVAFATAFFPELVDNYVEEYADGIRPRLTVALLNRDIALVGVSGEFFCQHSIRLRERARVGSLFFFGYCNGYHQYFPTIEAAAEGGYGADSQVAPAEVGAGEQIMDKALIRILQMQHRLSE